MARTVFIRGNVQVRPKPGPLGIGATARPSRGGESRGFFRLNVSSTCVRWLGWDNDNRTLRVKFQTGGLYDYFDVHPQTVRAMANAGSVGRAFWRLLRDRYAYARVG